MASPVRQRGVQNSCGHCGAHVSHDFARVFGDNDGFVHRCPNCTVARSIYAGAAAGITWTQEEGAAVSPRIDADHEHIVIQSIGITILLDRDQLRHADQRTITQLLEAVALTN